MIAILSIVTLVSCALPVGSAALRFLRINRSAGSMSLLESFAAGLGLLAYLVLAVGWAGFLKSNIIWGSIVAAGVGCAFASRQWLTDLMATWTNYHRWRVRVNASPRASKWGSAVAATVLSLTFVIALVNAFVPPGAHEWDVLSYHLAAPKAFLIAGRIIGLPTDHHSHFPFLLEMLFTAGFSVAGFAAANLVHLVFGVLLVAAMAAIARERFGPGSGWWAALAIATTPVFLWESGTAYIELGFCLFVLMAVGRLLNYSGTRKTDDLLAVGFWLGLALGTKALGLIPTALILVVLIFQRVPIRSLTLAAIIAIALGSPFYFKAFLWTGDPVYPFGWPIFKGRLWNADLANAYAGSQKQFGFRHEITSPADDLANKQPSSVPASGLDKARNLILSPFGLISTPHTFYDYADPGWHNHLGFMFLVLTMIACVSPKRREGRLLIVLTLTWWAIWGLTMQYARYAMPIAMLGILAGASAMSAHVTVVRRGVILAALAAQCALCLIPFIVKLPIQLARATDDQAQEAYLKRVVNHYEASKWINEHTDRESGVVLFEEARGFYLDRSILWGNELHSTFIPYAEFNRASDMIRWFRKQKVDYALVNLLFAQASSTEAGRIEMKDAVEQGKIALLFLKWYDNAPLGGERWRKLLGEAVREGLAVLEPEASKRGVVVLRFIDPNGANK